MVNIQLTPDDVEHIIESLENTSSWNDQRIAQALRIALSQ